MDEFPFLGKTKTHSDLAQATDAQISSISLKLFNYVRETYLECCSNEMKLSAKNIDTCSRTLWKLCKLLGTFKDKYQEMEK